MRILLTGSGGFVGSHALKYLLTQTDVEIICLISLQHRGTSSRLRWAIGEWIKNSQNQITEADVEARVTIIRHDLTAPIDAVTQNEIGPIDVIWNIASESHVDRSITDPVPFVMNNTALMLNILEYARVAKPSLFLQMSTDEVYGPAPVGHNHVEWETLLPSNPYSASKAAQEMIAFSYWRTYGVPVVITNTMNIFGETQDSEKYPAKIMQLVTEGKPVPVHVSPTGEIGSRYYLHAHNLADAWWYLTLSYVAPADLINESLMSVPHYSDGVDRPAKFNIVGEQEVDNLQFAKMIATAMNKELTTTAVDFHSSRPGHDLRYALDGSLMESIGWSAPYSLEQGIAQMVDWTLTNPEWWV